MTTFATGSGLEREMNCRASSVLHRAFDQRGSEHSTRGVELHAHMQRVIEGMAVDESLDMVDERFREAARGVDVDDVIREFRGLTAELSLAYNPLTDTARVLGVSLDREYEAAGVTDDEIPLTIDVGGLDGSPPSRGLVVDHKTGWSKRTPAARNWQMRGGALALARAYDLDEVVVCLNTLRDGLPAHKDRAVFTAADLAVFAAEARARRLLALDDRKRHAASGGQWLPDATQGTWCDYCPSYFGCPAKVGLVRAAVARDEIDDLTRVSPLPPDAIADAYRRLRDLKRPVKMLESAIMAAANERPVLIERLADGSEVWLGQHLVTGNESLDGKIAKQVVIEMLGPEAVDEVFELEITKKRLDEAIKKRVPRGKGAEKQRAILAEIRKRNGATRKTKHEVTTYKVAPALPPGGAS